MRLDSEAIAVECACGGLEDQVEGVFCIDSEAGNLGARHVVGSWDRPGFVTVAVEAETAEFRGREDDRVPFEDDGGLGRVAAAEGGGSRRIAAEFGEEFGLEGGKGAVGVVFCGEVAGDVYVDDAAGGDVWREEDRGEFNLMLSVTCCWMRL